MQYKGYTAKVEFDHDAGVLFGEVEAASKTSSHSKRLTSEGALLDRFANPSTII